MKSLSLFLIMIFVCAVHNFTKAQRFEDTLKLENKNHFRNVKQLSFGGNNAEAYFSFDNTKFGFQSDYKGFGVTCN